MGECLRRTGTSVALTSINNMVAFFMAVLVPIPALRAFSLQVRGHEWTGGLGWARSTEHASSSLLSPQAAIVVGCNFAAVMLVFPAVLSLDLRRRHRQRLDVLCCFSRYYSFVHAHSRPRLHPSLCPALHSNPSALSDSPSPCSAQVIQMLPQELGDRAVPVGIAHLTATVQAFTHCEASSQHVVTILPPQAHLLSPTSDPLGSELYSPGGSTRDLLGQEEGTRPKASCRSLLCAHWTLAHFARYQFAPLLLQTQAKVSPGGAGWRLRVSGSKEGRGLEDGLLALISPQALVLLFFGALLGLSLYGATLVQDGLALTDVVPRGTKEHAFLSAQLRYFSLYEVALVTQGGFDYAHSQRALFDLHQRFSSLKAVLPPPAAQAPRTWLHYYRSWLQGKRPRGQQVEMLPGAVFTAVGPILVHPVCLQVSRPHLTKTGLLGASPATLTATALKMAPWPTSCSSKPGMPRNLWISTR